MSVTPREVPVGSDATGPLTVLGAVPQRQASVKPAAGIKLVLMSFLMIFDSLGHKVFPCSGSFGNKQRGEAIEVLAKSS